MRLSRLHRYTCSTVFTSLRRLIKPLLAQPSLFQTPFSFRAHFLAPSSSSRRISSTNPQPQPQATPTPFIDNVATLFNVSALSSKERPLHATIILSDGGIEQRDLDRRTLKMESGLAGRDIRVIDGGLNSATSILPRARSIVLNFNSIRAVILHNRVAFFMPLSQAALEIIPVLQARLREEDSQKFKHSSSHPRHPFEFHVLECLLLVSCRQLPPTTATPKHNQNFRSLRALDVSLQAVGAARARANAAGGSRAVESAVDAERHVEPVPGRARDAQARSVRCVARCARWLPLL
jgi:hypothetical protein